jgi:hypothetical protein
MRTATRILQLVTVALAGLLVAMLAARLAQWIGLDDATPRDVMRRTVQLGVPVIIARIVVYTKDRQRAQRTGAPRREHPIWTFGFPTVGLGVWLVRLSITQSLDVFSGDDWVTPASYVVLVSGQAIATIYQWMPEEVYERARFRLDRF